jgi:putative redox protein
MIEATSEHDRYRTRFTNGIHSADSDATPDKGGSGSGFRPHDLLEAAFATCMNIFLRMCADQNNIPLTDVKTKVRLDRTTADVTVFNYEIELPGSLIESDRERLLEMAKKCPVRQTLSKRIEFHG